MTRKKNPVCYDSRSPQQQVSLLSARPLAQLAPNFFLPLMKTTSFLYYFSEKIISIDKIPPILQAFKFVISCTTPEHGEG